jgi:hypothetical protein
LGERIFLIFCSIDACCTGIIRLGNDDPIAYPIVDEDGALLNFSIVADGYEALSAGTEISDEIPDHTAFLNQTKPDAGVPILGGLILGHPGFAPVVDEGILSYPKFSNANFRIEGYEFIGIEVTFSDTDRNATMPSETNMTMQPETNTTMKPETDQNNTVPPACLTIGTFYPKTHTSDKLLVL